METIRNLLATRAEEIPEETIQSLIQRKDFTLEHIVSRGMASPEGFWYDQDRPEWVLLIQGEAELRFDDGERLRLTAGDSLTIAARRRHRVEHATTDAVWLALHYQED